MSPTQRSPGTSAAVATATTPGKPSALRDVDARHARARMRRQHDGAVQHARALMSATNGRVAERELGALVALRTLADAAVLDQSRQRAAAVRRLDQLDGVDDLRRSRCSGTGARRCALRDLARVRDAVLVDQIFGPQRDARDAEPALQAGGGLEGAA